MRPYKYSYKYFKRAVLSRVSTVGNISDCRSRGLQFNPGPVTYFFVEIDHEIISMAPLPSADLRRVVVSCRRKYVHKVLVNGLVKFAQEKSVVR